VRDTGIASAGDRPDARLVRQMCDTLVHRGPDGSGFHDDDHDALGMRRLGHHRTWPGARQPVYNEDRTVAAVFNGELYNFRGLRELCTAGCTGSSRMATPNAWFHLYEDYGDDLVHHLRGMFAFAIWDVSARRLAAGPGPGGQEAACTGGKTGHHWLSDRNSRPWSLTRRSTAVSIRSLCTHYPHLPVRARPAVHYQGIQKLPPGHLLSWQDGGNQGQPYWRLDFTQRPVTSVPEAAEQLRGLLLDATRYGCSAKRPLGAFLSGGLDSRPWSPRWARQTSSPVKTFSHRLRPSGIR